MRTNTLTHTPQKQADDNMRDSKALGFNHKGNNEEPCLELLGLYVCMYIIYICIYTEYTYIIYMSLPPILSTEQPIGGSKQSPTENSSDYTNDDYGDNDHPAISLVITVCCI